MSQSLQDQLKNSGLVDEKKAKQLSRAKRKEEKLARKEKKGAVSVKQQELHNTQSGQRAAMKARDKQLNLEKNTEAEGRAVAAQIKQLIETNSIDKGTDQKYSFADGRIIKHIWISQRQVEQLSRGIIAIVKPDPPHVQLESKAQQADHYLLVPKAVADKIAQRDADTVIFKAEQAASDTDDDPYADYQIPDDLTW